MELKNKFVTFQPGMPVSMAELKERAQGVDFNSLIEYTEENTNACTIVNTAGQIIHVVPILGNEVGFVDINLLKAKGWSIIIDKQRDSRFTALTDSFWNCACKEKSIHHKIVGRCEVCKKNSTIKQMDSIENLLKDSFQWKVIVEE
jgi:hypothetical protein